MTIAIVGKYTGLKDAYKSLNEALKPRRHGEPGQGPSRMDKSEIFETRIWRLLEMCMESWFPAVLAARRGRKNNGRELSRANTKSLISVSASECRWR